MKKIILVLSLFILSSCVETVVVGAIATGIMLSREEKVSDSVSDVTTKYKISRKVKKYDKKYAEKKFNDVNISIIEDRVLLTGIVKNKKDRTKLQKMVWETESDIKEVINEVKIAKKKKRDKIKDTLITSQIKTKYKAKMDIKSFNYDVITVDKTVYLFGIAQNSHEMELTANIASRIRGVKNVISHVVLKYDRRR